MGIPFQRKLCLAGVGDMMHYQFSLSRTISFCMCFQSPVYNFDCSWWLLIILLTIVWIWLIVYQSIVQFFELLLLTISYGYLNAHSSSLVILSQTWVWTHIWHKGTVFFRIILPMFQCLALLHSKYKICL